MLMLNQHLTDVYWFLFDTEDINHIIICLERVVDPVDTAEMTHCSNAQKITAAAQNFLFERMVEKG